MPTITPVPPQGQSGNTYYVATDGYDANPGTLDQPWLTIQKAANTMVAGDTVVVQAGNYAVQRVQVTRSGSLGATITYQADGTVTMKGFNVQANYIAIRGFEIANTDYVRWNTSTSAGIYLRGSDNVIEANYIHDSALEGIEIYGTPGEPTISSNNIIRNNQLYHNEMVGINVNGRNNLIEGNEVWGSVQCHPTLMAVEDNAADNPNHLICPNYPGVGGLDADGMRFFGQGHVFRGNSIHDIPLGPSGINPATGDYNDVPHIDCFQTWSGTDNEAAQNIIFEQNFCENLNQGMYAFMLDGGANNLTIKNNIIKAFGGINTGQTGQHHLYIYNNLWINDLSFGSQGYPNAIGLMNAPYSIVKNNIFYNQPYQTITAIGDTTGQSIDYNLAFNSNGMKAKCMLVGDYVCVNPLPAYDKWDVDPRFANPGINDYHLQASSPAIGTGEGGVDIGP
jgi:parallel beta-helix repeat protein